MYVNIQIAFGPSLRNGDGKVYPDLLSFYNLLTVCFSRNLTVPNPAPTMAQTASSIDGSKGPIATKESSSEPSGSSNNRSQAPTQWRAMLSFLSDVYLGKHNYTVPRLSITPSVTQHSLPGPFILR
jgi:hypothetical protein